MFTLNRCEIGLLFTQASVATTNISRKPVVKICGHWWAIVMSYHVRWVQFHQRYRCQSFYRNLIFKFSLTMEFFFSHISEKTFATNSRGSPDIPHERRSAVWNCSHLFQKWTRYKTKNFRPGVDRRRWGVSGYFCTKYAPIEEYYH